MLGSFSVSAMKKTGAPGRVGEGLKMIAIDHFSEKFQRNMRVPLHIVEARRDKLAQLIETHRYLPLRELCERLGVSEATARRDLAELAKRNVVKRTHGGALAEYNERFPSFNERRSLGGAGKQKVAKAATRFIEPGGTYFLDSGTTIFAMAEFLREAPVTPATIVTSNLPVGELLAGVEGLSVYLTAGQILGRQSVLLGETALHSLEFWNFDIAFLSAEAANAEGVWNSQEAIVEMQRVAMERSKRVLLCLDDTKIGATAPQSLVGWDHVDILLTDAKTDRLRGAGILPGFSGIIDCHAAPPLPPRSVGNTSELPVHFL